MAGKHAVFRFYAELNDLLPARRRQVAFEHEFSGSPSVKDMIESLGVPHTEVEVILVNGLSVDFAYLVQDGDHVSVYPVFESLDVGRVVRLRAQPLRRTRFVLDVHLGRLAAYLRLLGFDVVYRNDLDDEALADISLREGRILLTRDRQLPKRSQVTHAYCVRETSPREQLAEIVTRFDLRERVAPFTRCLSCNGLLEPVAKEQVLDRLPPAVRREQEEFVVCGECGRVYWKGSHYRRMLHLLEGVLVPGVAHSEAT